MKNRTSTFARCVLASSLLIAAAAAPLAKGQAAAARVANAPAATQGASISGTVLAASTSKPVMGALVTIVAPELPGGRSVLSDDKGRFQVTGLPAGRYTITASKPGFLDLVYGQRRPLMEGEVIELDAGEAYPNTDCKLIRAGAIAGRIVDQNGEPLAGATIELLQAGAADDHRVASLGTVLSDDCGTYRFWGLMPGTYFVKAAAPTLGQATPVLDPAFFPGVRSFEQARAITIGISQEAANIAIELPAVAPGQ